MARTPQGMRPAHAARRTVFALSGLSGSADLLPTVGSGIRPDLLTFRGCESARGLASEDTYRRWGIAPRPEDVAGKPAVRILAPSHCVPTGSPAGQGFRKEIDQAPQGRVAIRTRQPQQVHIENRQLPVRKQIDQ